MASVLHGSSELRPVKTVWQVPDTVVNNQPMETADIPYGMRRPAMLR